MTKPAGPTGLFLYGRDQLPAMQSFDDIPVVPVQENNSMVLLGGPVWPHWRLAGPLRHNRSGLPVDRQPPAQPDRQQVFEGQATWGGHAVGHFGHFITEHSSRILQSRVEHPDLPMLFTLEPGKGAGDLPKFFWQILSWYQVPKDQVRFVSRPLRVARLWAAPQAEQWAQVPTSEAYLDLLDSETPVQSLPATSDEIVYVARDRMQETAEGHNAGEPYLTTLLEQLGVTVIRPETLSLEEQLAYYHSAKVLIFAEGSAMHGRQLLGRRDQTIIVLNRRPAMRIGLSALQPRVSAIGYAEVTKGTISVLWPGGKPWIVRAVSIYDVEVLLATFDRLGLPLSSLWDQDAYEAARDYAIRHWIKTRFARRQPIDHKTSAQQVRKDLTNHGLEHLAQEVPYG